MKEKLKEYKVYVTLSRVHDGEVMEWSLTKDEGGDLPKYVAGGANALHGTLEEGVVSMMEMLRDSAAKEEVEYVLGERPLGEYFQKMRAVEEIMEIRVPIDPSPLQEFIDKYKDVEVRGPREIRREEMAYMRKKGKIWYGEPLRDLTRRPLSTTEIKRHR